MSICQLAVVCLWQGHDAMERLPAHIERILPFYPTQGHISGGCSCCFNTAGNTSMSLSWSERM